MSVVLRKPVNQHVEAGRPFRISVHVVTATSIFLLRSGIVHRDQGYSTIQDCEFALLLTLILEYCIFTSLGFTICLRLLKCRSKIVLLDIQ